MSNSCLKNISLINPGDAVAENSSISFSKGLISNVGSNESGEVLLDGGGELFALPGFIDIHTHGANGCDFTFGTLDAMKTIAEAKLKEGVTTFLPTTWTESPECLLNMAKAGAEYRAAGEPFARTPFLHVEGPYLNVTQAGAQDPDLMRPPSVAEITAMHEICPVGLISIAPELDGMIEFIEQMVAMGITVSAAHTAATRAEFQRARAAGLRHLTHFCNQMSGLHHREIGLVGAALLDDEVMIEMICDTIHLCPDMIELVFRLRSLDRIMLITDSIAASHLGDGTYPLGHTDIIVKDGAARIPAGNLAGSILKFDEGLRNVAKITGLPLNELARTTSKNQADSLGLADRGTLEVGKLADLVLLNQSLEVVATIVGGELVYQA